MHEMSCEYSSEDDCLPHPPPLTARSGEYSDGEESDVAQDRDEGNSGAVKAKGDSASASFDRLLQGNRAPRVSELRTALLAAYSASPAGAADAERWLFQTATAATHARLAFSDAMSLHQNNTPRAVLKPRQPKDAADGGGLMLAAGVYAACDLAVGDVITLYDIHGLDSTMCSSDHVRHDLILDQRLTFDGADEMTAESVANEGLALGIGAHSTGYHFAGALSCCPYRLGQYVNDVTACPAVCSVESLEAYETASLAGANSQRVAIMGFALHQVATRSIAKGEEITTSLGAIGWERTRAVKGRPSMRPLVNEQAASLSEGADDQAGV
jgi:hypothetical protein